MEIGQLFNSSSNLIWEMDRKKKKNQLAVTQTFPKENSENEMTTL